MPQFPRYAIYYAPDRAAPLHRFGAEVLGYDAGSGAAVAHPPVLRNGYPDWADITAAPRKYGFHATLKAPFSLAPGVTEAELVAACLAFARLPRAIPLITPVVDMISGFTALIPSEPSPQLNMLAQDCVAAFDHFRAPMSPEDRARRNPAGLTSRQVAQLDRWGYPYVLDDFRFHMTLTGRLPVDRQADIVLLLRREFSRLDLAALKIDRIALFRQDAATERFHDIAQFQLSAADNEGGSRAASSHVDAAHIGEHGGAV